MLLLHFHSTASDAGPLCSSLPHFCVWAQELAVGKTLAEMVGEGQRLDEGEVERIAQQLLGVADYLGRKRPAVIHR